MLYETELVPYRPEGWPMARDRALGSRTEVGRSSGQVLSPRDHQRNSVCHAQWLHVAEFATRLPTLSDCVSLFSPVAARRHVGADSRGVARAGATQGGQKAQTVGCDPRQPKCEDHRARRATRLRCGKKRWPAANGTWSSIRSDSCGRWLLHQLTCKTATAVDWLWKHFAAKSSGPRFSGQTRHIERWLSGHMKNGVGSSKSSPDPLTSLKFNPSDGSSNAPSAGSIGHVVWPSLTNVLLKAIRHSYKSP